MFCLGQSGYQKTNPWAKINENQTQNPIKFKSFLEPNQKPPVTPGQFLNLASLTNKIYFLCDISYANAGHKQVHSRYPKLDKSFNDKFPNQSDISFNSLQNQHLKQTTEPGTGAERKHLTKPNNPNCQKNQPLIE